MEIKFGGWGSWKGWRRIFMLSHNRFSNPTPSPPLGPNSPLNFTWLVYLFVMVAAPPPPQICEFTFTKCLIIAKHIL